MARLFRIILNWLVIVGVLLALSARSGMGENGLADAGEPVRQPAGHTQTLKVGGHVLAIQPDSLTIAAADHALRMEFVDANLVEPAIRELEGGEAHELDQVTWTGLWDGISLTYRSVTDGIVESVYTMAAGAAVKAIRLHYNAEVALNADGSLAVRFPTGQMNETAPRAWQEIDGRQVAVEVAFEVVPGQNMVGFALGDYNPAYSLTIDPSLSWTTYLSSGNHDEVHGLVVDAGGNVYVAGTSSIAWGSPVVPFHGGDDAFVAKFNSSGTLQWTSFFGCERDDLGSAVSLDGSGNIYLAGNSDCTWGSPINPYNSWSDFVVKLNPSGALVWNTFLGPNGTAAPFNDIEVTSGGVVYVTGTSSQSWGTPIVPFNTDPGNYYDAYVARLTTNGGLVWNTFLGGPGSDFGNGVGLDASGYVLVGGASMVSWGSPQRAFTVSTNNADAFVAKLNGAGVLQWNTFLGGSGYDFGRGLAVDSAGNSYIGGLSNIAGWGTNPPNPWHSNASGFVAKVDSAGQYVWNTFIGEGSNDVYAIAVDASNHVYVTGDTQRGWGTPVDPYATGWEGYITQLSTVSGVQNWTSFWGGDSTDQGRGVGVGPGNTVFSTGFSYGDWGSPMRDFTGMQEGVLVKLNSSGSILWNTFLGAANNIEGLVITTDTDGSTYLAGVSPGKWGEPVAAYNGKSDAWVVKMDSAGQVVWSTFLGGAENDSAYGLVVDSSRHLLVCGYSMGGWGTPKRAYSGAMDSFVASLNPDSGDLQWNTFLGGSGSESCNGISADSNNNIYHVGFATVSWGSPVRAFSTGYDAYVAKLNPDGVLMWNTFLGGSAFDNGLAIAVKPGASANVYVAGESAGAWAIPGLPSLRGYTASNDMFVAEVNPTSGAVAWFTFLGGSASDGANSLAIDSSGRLYVAGYSSSSWGSPLNAYTGGTDIAVVRLASNGALQWTTFLGSSNGDGANKVLVSPNGMVYLAGNSSGSWGNPLTPYGGQYDGVAAGLDSNGRLMWNAFLFGPAYEVAYTAALNPNGTIMYVAGYGYGINPGYNSGWSTYVTRFDVPFMVNLPFVVR